MLCDLICLGFSHRNLSFRAGRSFVLVLRYQYLQWDEGCERSLRSSTGPFSRETEPGYAVKRSRTLPTFGLEVLQIPSYLVSCSKKHHSLKDGSTHFHRYHFTYAPAGFQQEICMIWSLPFTSQRRLLKSLLARVKAQLNLIIAIRLTCKFLHFDVVTRCVLCKWQWQHRWRTIVIEDRHHIS